MSAQVTEGIPKAGLANVIAHMLSGHVLKHFEVYIAASQIF